MITLNKTMTIRLMNIFLFTVILFSLFSCSNEKFIIPNKGKIPESSKINLKSGDNISVLLASGRKIEGRVILVRNEGLILRTTNNKNIYFKWSELRKVTIVRTRPSSFNILTNVLVITSVLLGVGVLIFIFAAANPITIY